MPARIVAAGRATRVAVEETPEVVVRCILDSLAVAFAAAIADAERLSGRPVDVVHLVGGGARNALLCQLTADAAGRPVLAGPVEATALGNLLVQARTHGVLAGDLAALRVWSAPPPAWTGTNRAPDGSLPGTAGPSDRPRPATRGT